MNKILIVDDNEHNVQQVHSILEKYKYSSGFLLEPEFFFDRLRYESFDIVLMDVNMPNIDGLTLLKQIKANDEFKEIPVIMLTADDNEKVLKECFDAGATDFIKKPISEVELISRLKTIIANTDYVRRIKMQSESLRKSKETLDNLYGEIMEDLERAKETQKSLVALEFPDSDKFRLFTYFKPMEKVGGDFISYEICRDGRIDILFGDVSGHGTSAAMISCMAVLAFKMASSRNVSPAEGLRTIQNLLSPLVIEHHIVGIYVSYYPDSGKIDYSYAGHHEMILLSGEEMIPLPGRGMPLLIIPNPSLIDYTFQLKPGSKVFLYSDGLPEAMDNEQRIFGFEELNDLCNEYHALPGQKILESIADDVLKFCDGNVRDDMTMLLMEIL
ncbi:MAG: SpoIIE family protein phosphatase [Leptospira sp.]|nr:SpoIIE family protein phosphatase [Leptospira sp.]